MDELSHDSLLLAKIRRVLAQEDTVLFIGAGLSRWSGLPGWRQLIEELAVFLESQGQSGTLVRKELQANDLLQAASYGVHQLSKTQFAEFIRRACRVGQSTPHEIHRKVITLGPRCFITTNYDHLIEQSLSKWRTDEYFKVVSNKQLTETADIVQARANHFVFKPHGDVDDSDSIVLTREQYRTLHGERIHILRAVETLLVSRPIVFIGYSLRDLDFMFVKDLLALTYKGGAIDHYAIMPNVMSEEKRYWQQKFGVHILSYPTQESDTGIGESHLGLLVLLDSLLLSETEDAPPTIGEPSDLAANEILALARYASRLIPNVGAQSSLELPLRITLNDPRSFYSRFDILRFNDSSIERFLETFGGNALLVGNPGAGKSYSFMQACSRMAQRLHDACLRDDVPLRELVIPLHIDLKLYDGNLWRTAEEKLPPELSLEKLLASGTVRLFIDSFNEMPREYFENEGYEEDFDEFFTRTRQSVIIFGSRTDEGLSKYDFPKFRLDEIDRTFIAEHLAHRGENLTSEFQSEILDLLQKPLFFRLYDDGILYFDNEAHPRQVYRSLFNRLAVDLESRLRISIPLEDFLAPIGFNLIDEGQEALNLSQLQIQLRRQLNTHNEAGVDEMQLINWLISRNVLVPASGSRLTFFHQSLTEFLGGRQLAKLYKNAPEVLDRILQYTRWDQAIFTTLGFLEPGDSRAFIQQVLDTDLELSVRSAKFVESDRNELVALILDRILKKESGDVDDIQFTHLLEGLPVTIAHDHILRQLLERRNILGGAAAILLAQIHGAAAKSELVDELFDNPDDYNYCTSVAQALAPFMDVSDLPKVLERLAEMEVQNVDDDAQGLTSGLTQAFSHLDIVKMLRLFSPWQQLNDVQLEFLCELLRDSESAQALEESVRLVIEGARPAIVSLHFRLSFSKDKYQIDRSLFTEDLICALAESFVDEDNGDWAVRTLRQVIEIRPDLSTAVIDQACQAQGIVRLVLFYCIPDLPMFWSELSLLAKQSSGTCGMEHLSLLEALGDLDWKGHESNLMALLKKREPKLVRHLLESVYSGFGNNQNLDIAIEPVDWWLQWMEEVDSSDREFGRWFCDRVASFWMSRTVPSNVQLIVEKFNETPAIDGKVIADYFLPRITNLTTDMLSEDAISFLLTLAADQGDVLLGSVATETFAQQRLLPLLDGADEPLKSTLRTQLRIAGQRHRRRYVTEELL